MIQHPEPFTRTVGRLLDRPALPFTRWAHDQRRRLPLTSRGCGSPTGSLRRRLLAHDVARRLVVAQAPVSGVTPPPAPAPALAAASYTFTVAGDRATALDLGSPAGAGVLQRVG
jgi:hypothetical protein